MNPAVTLCAHLADDALAALPVEPDDALEWQDGPIAAVVRCGQCGRAALLELLDWRAGGRLRVYSLAGIEPEAVALYQRNGARGSCDLARRQRELEALIASAGAPARLVARDASGAIVQSGPWPAHAVPPVEPWQTRVAAPIDAGWFAALGIDRDG